MKIITLMFAVLLIYVQTNAQDGRSAFRKGYQRIGITSLGNSIDNNLSAKENLLRGNYGAKRGFVFEFGHNYYFKKNENAKMINYGLDWTILSASYHNLTGWNSYPSTADMQTPVSLAVSSRLGPVVSINPVEKLVIDLRVQFSPVMRFTNFSYSEDGGGEYQYYALFDEDADDINTIAKNSVAVGFGTNLGISVRRKAIGLALDFVNVKSKTNLFSESGSGDLTKEKVSIKSNNLQLKLSLTF